MKLIDAEKLLKQKQIELTYDGEYKEVWVVHEEDIDNAPTVDPVKHGKWIVEKVPYSEPLNKYTCSECGDNFETVSEVAKKFRYCRSCGAKMDNE